MQINRKTRLQLKLQSSVFLILILAFTGLLAWFSTQFQYSIDLTANQRNSLSDASLRLLKSIDQPLKITAFISPVNELKESLDVLFERYADAQATIEYDSVNPDLVPEQLREFDIQRDGEVVIEYGGRSENLLQITETTVTNTIARLMREGERWVVFLQGHGERDPYSEANYDLQFFATRLSQKGFHIETVNLLQSTQIPANTDILVIADARTALLPGEISMIEDYIESGGNLLWLSEGVEENSLEGLAEQLELEFLPGVIVDPSSQVLGLSRVDFALVADYPRHAITTAIDSLSLFPRAKGMLFHGQNSDWEAEALLATQARSWNETGELKGKISPDAEAAEQVGPLTLGYSLSRSLQNADGELHTQRVVVTGDSDFLTNQYLGNGSNLALGLNMIDWLSHDDNLIAIAPRSAIDTQLELSPNSQLMIAVVFLLALPLLLLASGIRIWLVRRKR
jgi:ABC-type uncharacterized transport system involved in gliding motility auxiliary subunit